MKEAFYLHKIILLAYVALMISFMDGMSNCSATSWHDENVVSEAQVAKKAYEVRFQVLTPASMKMVVF
jgi:hypothetical protein